MVNKKALIFIILVSLLFNFMDGDFASAKFEISDEDTERISTAFDLLKTFGNAVLPQELKNILNTTVKGVGIGTDITYGVLVLSATNEMEFIDMVTSQKYKTKSDEYFNSILDQRLNLYKHIKGTVSDITTTVFSKTTLSPISALSLNTFVILNDSITAILGINIIKSEKVYDGLWLYFDAKRNGETNQTAWEDAKTKIPVSLTINTSKFGSKTTGKDLELQFASLWQNWKDKTTAAGVKPEVKQAFNQEMQALALEAAATYAQQKPEPSFLAKVSSAITSFVRDITEKTKSIANNILNSIKEIGANIAKFNPFSAGVTQYLRETKSPSQGEPSIQIVNEPSKKPVQVGRAQEEPSPPTPEPKPIVQTQSKKEKVEEKPQEKLEEIKQKEQQEEKPTPLPASLCGTSSNASPLLNSVVFNEIAWMGTANSSNDEWIELKNISSSSVNLAGWQIQDKDGQIHIVFDTSHSIAANGFFLLERTDENTLSGISADMLYKGALSNTNEELFLLDKNCAIQDRVQASPNWPAGETSSKQTMERRKDLAWQTSASSGGTPKQENGAGFIPFIDSSSAGAQGSPTLTLPTTYPAILITEVQTAGQSSQTEEFVELYNPTSQSVDMTEWYLQKKTQSASSFSTFASKTLFAGKQIPAYGYFLIAREGSAFANNADILVSSSLADNNTLALKNPNGDIADKVGWGDVQDSETAPAQNPPSGNSLMRTYNSATQSYQDTNNNSADFTIAASPTPKLINEIAQQQNSLLSQASDSSSEASASATENSSPLSSAENSSPENSTPVVPPPAPAPAPEPSRIVVFNEIAWMGTTINTADEWIELASTTSTVVDLIGWKIKIENENHEPTTIELANVIAPGDYFLLERSADDLTISDIVADLTYTGALRNEGEKLSLYDSSNVLIDEVDASTGWFTENTAAKQTMERVSAATSGSNSANWVNNNLITHNGKAADGLASINGTPRAQNSVSKTETKIDDVRFSEFSSITLTFLGSPYLVNGSIGVPQNKTLNIEPGVTVRFERNSSALFVDGTLKAIGSSQKGITFTSGSSGNAWCGVVFSSASTNSELDYITIEDASGCGDQPARRSILVDGATITLKHATLISGDSRRRIHLKNSNSVIDSVTISGANEQNNPEATGILIEGGSPTITNSVFSNNGIGILNALPSGTPTITNNTFTNNIYPIKFIGSSGTLAGNSASANTYNGILLESGGSTNLTLEKDSIPYLIQNFTVQNSQTLTIKPGVVIKFAQLSGYSPFLTVGGTLLAQGTEAEPIMFTALGDNDVGGVTVSSGANQNWQRIFFDQGSTGTFDYATIKKGGDLSDQIGMIQVDQGNITINNSTLQQSGKHAFYSDSGTITIQNTTIEVPSSSYAFRIQTGNCPIRTNVSITGQGQAFVPDLVVCSL